MQSRLTENHWSDANGNPAGGCSFGNGFAISWQNGPLGRDGDRIEPNGAFVEDVIRAVIGRIQFYEASKFASQYNKDAMGHLALALGHLQQRTIDREKRSVEGTHSV